MDAAASLLELQRLDAEADGLRVRRAELPERAALRGCADEAVGLGSEREAIEARRQAQAAEERRLEGEVTEVRARAEEVEGKLYGGGVKELSELEGLQLELDSLRGRKAALEEEELGVMEQMEAAEAELAGLGERGEALAARVAELEAALAAGEAEIDAELAQLDAAREVVTPALAAEVLAVYARLREQPRLEGRVVARFEGDRCIGCRVALPITEATRIKRSAPDEFVQCPRCHRLLVR